MEVSMTEAEWLACADPFRLMQTMPTHPSLRKWRLLSCAFCRLVWDLLDGNGCREDVELAERFADGQATREELTTARTPARRRLEAVSALSQKEAAHAVLYALLDEGSLDGYWSGVIACGAASEVLSAVSYRPDALAAVLLLVIEVMGNPFRLARPAVSQTRDTLAVARAAYEARESTSGRLDNARLAVLADSLEEAGCTDADLLSHLRSPGPHVRGCWALDLMLGKQ
jgi:hypothetical protein